MTPRKRRCGACHSPHPRFRHFPRCLGRLDTATRYTGGETKRNSAREEVKMGEMPLGSCRPTVDRDANLVEALRRHEAGAAEALIAAYGDRAYRLAMRMTGNRSDAEEDVQDAFWTVVQKIETFRGDAAFGSWLYRITANCGYTKLRVRRARHHETSLDESSVMAMSMPRPFRTGPRVSRIRRFNSSCGRC